MSIIISNSSPLIALCSINRLTLLEKLWKEIVIPEAVYKEVVEDGAGKKGADIIANACQKWIKVVSVENVEEVSKIYEYRIPSYRARKGSKTISAYPLFNSFSGCRIYRLLNPRYTFKKAWMDFSPVIISRKLILSRMRAVIY